MRGQCSGEREKERERERERERDLSLQDQVKSNIAIGFFTVFYRI